MSTNFGFRFDFEPKFWPKSKDVMIPKPKCIPKSKFWPKPKPKVSDHLSGSYVWQLRYSLAAAPPWDKTT